jgi:hypothetical protein
MQSAVAKALSHLTYARDALTPAKIAAEAAWQNTDADSDAESSAQITLDALEEASDFIEAAIDSLPEITPPTKESADANP